MNREINLILPGSGFLLPVYVGAIKSLSSHKIMIRQIAATSGGAIAAVLYAANPSIGSLSYLVLEHDWSPFMRVEDLSGLFRLAARGGWCNPKALHKFLLAKTCNMRFRDLGELDLQIVATNLNTHEREIFSKDATPDVLLADAARASSSIPLIYPPYKLDGEYYVDGGMCDDAPSDLVDRVGVARENIGLWIGGKTLGNAYKNNVINEITNSFNTLFMSAAKLERKMRGVEWVDINVDRRDALNAGISGQEKMELLKKGEEAMYAHISDGWVLGHDY